MSSNKLLHVNSNLALEMFNSDVLDENQVQLENDIEYGKVCRDLIFHTLLYHILLYVLFPISILCQLKGSGFVIYKLHDVLLLSRIYLYKYS